MAVERDCSRAVERASEKLQEEFRAQEISLREDIKRLNDKVADLQGALTSTEVCPYIPVRVDWMTLLSCWLCPGTPNAFRCTLCCVVWRCVVWRCVVFVL